MVSFIVILVISLSLIFLSLGVIADDDRRDCYECSIKRQKLNKWYGFQLKKINANLKLEKSLLDELYRIVSLLHAKEDDFIFEGLQKIRRDIEEAEKEDPKLFLPHGMPLNEIDW